MKIRFSFDIHFMLACSKNGSAKMDEWKYISDKCIHRNIEVVRKSEERILRSLVIVD